MGIENIRRWHWVLIALIIGVVIGFSRHMTGDDITSRFGKMLSTQSEFERAITEKLDEDGPRFRNLIVYPERLPGTDRDIYVITGHYAELEPVEGGHKTNWKPASFVFPHSRQALENLMTSRNVPFRFAWWHAPTASISLWIAGSLLVIGGIWPTLVNLIAFGQFNQPPREKFNLAGAPAAAPAHPAALTQEDLDRVAQMGNSLENQLAASASQTLKEDPSAPGAAPARQLTATTLELAPADDTPDDRLFGANKDDFYPTERHAPPKSPHSTVPLISDATSAVPSQARLAPPPPSAGAPSP